MLSVAVIERMTSTAEGDKYSLLPHSRQVVMHDDDDTHHQMILFYCHNPVLVISTYILTFCCQPPHDPPVRSAQVSVCLSVCRAPMWES